MSEELNVCKCEEVHEYIIDEVRQVMPQDEMLYDLAELFKVFGDTTRIKILYALFSKEMCVCDIAVLLNMTKSRISHQLKKLKEMNLVKYRKVGKEVFYSLKDEHVKDVFETSLIHIKERCYEKDM